MVGNPLTENGKSSFITLCSDRHAHMQTHNVMHMCTYTPMHIHTHSQSHTRIHNVYTQSCTHACSHTHVKHPHRRLLVFSHNHVMHACTHTHTLIRAHGLTFTMHSASHTIMHTHTCTHAHTHTHTQDNVAITERSST